MLEALKVAARDYVESTEGPAAPLAGLQAAARLRLAAKDFVRAERSRHGAAVFCTCGIYDGPPTVPDQRTAWRHKAHCAHANART